MGILRPPIKVIPFLAVMYRTEGERKEVIRIFEDEFGVPRFWFGPFRVEEYTDYYLREMGSGLLKCFLFFERVVSSQDFYRYKLWSNQIEDEFRDRERKGTPRKVNLDPGFLSVSNLILLSTKNYYHRIPLSEGVFADLTLVYKRDSFHPLPWTYPDYKTDEALDFFFNVRKEMLEQIK